MTFVLPDVICEFCNQSKDLDLCRDPDLKIGADGETAWVCSVCQQPYNKNLLEQALLRIVQKRTALFQVQDLTCQKCNGMKQTNVTKDCACSGTFINTRQPDQHKQQLRVLHNIAKFHRFPCLAEELDWLLRK